MRTVGLLIRLGLAALGLWVVLGGPLPALAAAPARRDPAAAEEAHRRGIEAARAGRTRDAVEAFRRAVELEYGNVARHVAYGRALEAENPAAALFQYQLALKYAIAEARDSAPAVEFLRRQLVRKYIDLALPARDPEQSANLLRLAIALEPDDGRLHLNLAGAMFLGGDYRGALREARAAQALGLDDGSVRLNIAAAHLQLGETAAAAEAVRSAIAVDEFDFAATLATLRRETPDTRWVDFAEAFGRATIDRWIAESTKGRIETALDRLRRGDRARAIEIARAAVENDTSSSYGAIHLGDLHLAAGETAAAEAAYRLAERRDPSNVLAGARLGDLYWSTGRYAEAAAAYVPYLERGEIGDAHLGAVVRRAADSLARTGEKPRALRLLEDWLARNPRVEGAFEAAVERAEILSTVLGRHAEADRAFRALVEDHPLRPEAYRRLYRYLEGRTRAEEGRRIAREGLVKFDLAIEERPGEYALHRGRADLLALLERRNEAVAAILDGARKTGAYRAAANDLFALDAETEALSILRVWIEESGGAPEPLLYYAWVAAKADTDLDRALEHVRAVERTTGRTPPVVRTLARVQLARGAHLEAARLAEEVLAMGDDVPHAGTFHRIAAEAYAALEDPVKANEHRRRAEALGSDPDF